MTPVSGAGDCESKRTSAKIFSAKAWDCSVKSVCAHGLWYELQGDYYIPCLILSEEETQPIGLWGQRHKQYLKEHKQFLYTTMLIEGTLNSYLADIDRQAQERLLLLTKQIAEQENVTEKLKADNAMLWVQKMNEIQSRVREIIYSEIIYA